MNEDSRRQERTPVVQMLVVGVIASAIGIAVGLAIDWFPESGATQAGPMDRLYDVLIWSSVPVFVLVTVVVLFSVWKYRMRPGEETLDGPPIHGNTRLEVIWTAIPAIVLVALCSYAWVVLNDIEAAQPNEMRINVTGQQFAWTYEYPQPNGEPVKSSQLFLAEGQPVRFFVKAIDVIHDFWVPAFRMKIDAVPGIETKYRVTPNKRGSFPVVCAELCGLGHATMRSTARVVSPAEFRTWLAERQGEGGAAAGGTAAGGTAAGGAGGSAAEAEPDGKTLFAEGNGAATACGACHKLSDAATTASTGPDLDRTLAGKDADYIRTEIVAPDERITPGFQAGIMPKNYGDTLSSDELDALVSYLGRVAGK
jgi:cytochrome c oxidase subunit II